MYSKRILSAMTAAALALTAVSESLPASASAAEPETALLSGSSVKISGADSFGAMVANKFAETGENQLENNGYNVFSIEMEGSTAVVSYEAAQECSLVVAVYDDSGETMLGSGDVKVKAEENTAFVEISIENMPEYFSLKAFMVDPNTLRPKCAAYNSPMYTKAMREFQSKTTADFDENRVLNLDEDETKNFAVFSENVKIIHSSDAANTPEIGVPDESGITSYSFTNCDLSLSEVSEGDIFAVIYEEETIIAQAVSVETNGTSTVILGQDAEMERAFEHINISAAADPEDAVVDDTTLDERLEYAGTDYIEAEEKDTGAISRYALEKENVQKLSHKLKFKGSDDSLSGGLDISMEAGAALYYGADVSYIELSLGYELELYAAAAAEVDREMDLLKFTFSPISGVSIEVIPKFIVDMSAGIPLNGALSGSVGFKADTENGLSDISEAPKTELKSETEIKGFVGLSLVPEIKMPGDAVSVELDARSGVGIEAVSANGGSDPDVEHNCDSCISGTITPEYTQGVDVSFAGVEQRNTFEVKSVPTDFYVSQTFDDSGFTACPHTLCKTTVFVADSGKKPIAGATLYVIGDEGTEYTTDADGKTTFMLQNGEHTVIADADGYNPFALTFTVANKAAAYTITMCAKDEPSKPPVVIEPGWDFDGETYEPITEEPTTEEPGTEEPKGLTVTQVALGSEHSAAITENGDLYTWGKNNKGQLGNGTTENSLTPIKIMSNVKAVSLGYEHSAAITENGDLYTWGDNSGGILGNGTERDSSIPVKIMSNVKSVSLDWEHSAAITENGDLYTWGWNRDGQLGIGTGVSLKITPTKIMSNVGSVSLGWNASAAITENGDLYTWGWNAYGQLGNGTSGFDKPQFTPIKIMSNVKSVDLGKCHSAAITENGDLYTWGWNNNGQLGNGTTEDSSVPAKIMSNIKLVGLGWFHSAAITANGDLYTWGSNIEGQLGNGTTEDSFIPIKIMSNVKSVSLGWFHSAAITENSNLYTWGCNVYGMLGDGTTTGSSTPIKIVIDMGGETEEPVTEEPTTEEPGTEEVTFTQVALGYNHSGAITENGDLYTWGYNLHGELGNGTTEDSHNPIKIMSNVKSVNLGERHGAAITKNGDLYTWGENNNGQLGNGTTESSFTPVKIMSNVKAVSLGEWHSAAITENGDLYTWGYNSDGQLGNGTTKDSFIPIKIMSNIKSISLGNFHSAAITENSDLYTWGHNYYGQLGDGTTEDSYIPQKITGNVKSVSLGERHSAAITENGDLYTWGWNSYGQLGDGTVDKMFDSNPTPTKVMSNVKAVGLGWEHSAAITENGDLYTWGYNIYGQLGNGTTEDSSIPIKIMSNVKSVDFGHLFSALITENGYLYTWGFNWYGQLGNGTTEDSSTPIRIVIDTSGETEEPGTEEPSTEEPVTEEPITEEPETEEPTMTQVSLGSGHSAAITENGDLYTWGENISGQLGNGIIGNNYTLTKVMSNVKVVNLGYYHSAAITENGDLYTWGRNYEEQLGNATLENSFTPIKVMSNVKAVSLGFYHSAAITENGDLYTWGQNDYGQLGNGTMFISCSTPTKVMSNVKTVSLGYAHSAAITENGDLYTWGNNENGELGNGTTEASSTPIKIMSNVKAVSLGGEHSAAITESGDLYTWGDNVVGQLGNGTTERSCTPLKVMSDVKSVSLGDIHSAAITENGDLYTFGQNFYGKLGNGTTERSAIPIKIMGDVKVVSLGRQHSASITQNGTLYTWGNNEYGQLGNKTTEDSYVPVKITIPAADPTALTTTYMTYASAANGHKVSYKNLTPNTVYNFYSLRASAAQNLLSSDNLLYITQAVSDEDGKLTITFSPTEEVEGAVNVLRSIERIDIVGTIVDMPSQDADGTEKIAEPNVSYNDRPLEMGKDYLMSGGFSATKPGKYTLTLTGMGDFMGEIDVEWKLLAGSGYTVSGAITSSGDADALTMVELRNADGETVDTTTGATSYSFENVASGDYTLIVSKTKHCPREYAITVDGSNVEKDVEIWLYGDVNHDGKLNPSDVTQILRYCSKSKSIFDKGDDETKRYRILVASVINPGAAPTARDATQILRYTNRRSSVFDKIS